MALRPPPGRAGRQWLVRRLEVARRGADVLDQKRRALLAERRRLAAQLDQAERQWLECARLAIDANLRALALAGERQLRLAAGGNREVAEIRITGRRVIGTVVPVLDKLRAPDPADLLPIGGPSVALSAAAHARALEAAAAYAAVRAGHEAVTNELAVTSRRLRAIERRWIPRHEQALARLEFSLDESEREDIARVRWALDAQTSTGRQSGASAALVEPGRGGSAGSVAVGSPFGDPSEGHE